MSKDGLVATVIMIEHICRIWTKYSARATSMINLAAEEGTITTAQRDNLLSFFGTLNQMCTALKLVTGY